MSNPFGRFRRPLVSFQQDVPRPPEQGFDGSADGPPPFPPRPLPMPTPGQLRRERRALVRLREERIRDLGGLMLEMYRRDHFRQDLVVDHCTELTELERRLHELDSLLAATTGGRGMAGATRCACGAPIIWGSHFCANCGRPVGDAPVVACSQCGNPLPAEARFCASCGSRVEPPESPGAPAPRMSDAAPEPANLDREPEHPVDSAER